MAPKIRKEGQSKLTLDCDKCGDPVELSPQRYVELIKAGEKPRCRKNGCATLCPKPRTRGKSIATIKDGHYITKWPRRKRGNRNGALAKLHITTNEEALRASSEKPPKEKS